MPAILELRDVSKSYDSVVDGPPVQVLQGLTLTVQQGESWAIVGPSGCGKSTLLNIIGALDRPTTGQVIFQGEMMNSLNELQLADFRSRKLGFVFQAHHLLPQCTVLENVLVSTLAWPDKADRAKAPDRGRIACSRGSALGIEPIIGLGNFPGRAAARRGSSGAD